MFAVTVLLEVDDRHLPEFMAEMKKQARHSLEREKGCRQFDICADAKAPRRVFLYEIYTDKTAFDDHLKTGHFLDFDQRVKSWLISKEVECWERMESDGGKKEK